MTPAAVPAVMELVEATALKQLVVQVRLDRLAAMVPLTVEFTVTVVCAEPLELATALRVAGLGVTVTVPVPPPLVPL